MGQRTLLGMLSPSNPSPLVLPASYQRTIAALTAQNPYAIVPGAIPGRGGIPVRIGPMGWAMVAKGIVRALDPTQIPGLVLDHNPLTANVTLVGGKVSALANTAPATAADPNTIAVQAVAANRPVYVAADAAFGGAPSMQFVAANSDVLASTGAWAVAVPQPNTLIVVGAADGTAAHQDFTDGIVAGEIIESLASLYQIEAGAGPLSSAVAAVTASKILTGVFNGATSQVFVSSDSAKASGAAGANGLTGISLGASHVPGNFLNGRMARALLWNRVLTPLEIAQAQQFLSLKYGLPLTIS